MSAARRSGRNASPVDFLRPEDDRRPSWQARSAQEHQEREVKRRQRSRTPSPARQLNTTVVLGADPPGGASQRSASPALPPEAPRSSRRLSGQDAEFAGLVISYNSAVHPTPLCHHRRCLPAVGCFHYVPVISGRVGRGAEHAQPYGGGDGAPAPARRWAVFFAVAWPPVRRFLGVRTEECPQILGELQEQNGGELCVLCDAYYSVSGVCFRRSTILQKWKMQ